MKQSAAKTLGVAALGAAFAATAAGTASAANHTPVNGALGTATATALPVMQSAVERAPGTAAEVANAAPAVVGSVAKNASVQGVPLDPSAAAGLLGGLPVGGSLPVAGLGA
ncbi:ATP-binding protein [Streptomyces ficellus]|uniref:ATP-binding protein n=1 Tax=Streptomyces ficellus TaxID=1977088 RepID=A0ABT7Z8R2_9ACTN|nr:ATP-binding protein [Streptomyces ficellus]MDN3295895.1 ATP-binding protein [Streptomyces ficellus]